jgi:hypothetical protein
MELPRATARYITLQRLETQGLGRSIHYTRWAKLAYKIYERLPLAKRVFGFYSSTVEPQLRAGAIIRDYTTIMQQEYANMAPHLPPKASHIVGIGAGVGGLEILLARHYVNKGQACPHVTLIDKTGLDAQVHFGFHPVASVYNSLALAQIALVRNGVPATSTTMLEADQAPAWAEQHPHQVDVVTSLIAWGFHFPVATYLSLVQTILKPTGVLMIDVRKGTTGHTELAQAFGKVSVILDDAKFERLLCQNPKAAH